MTTCLESQLAASYSATLLQPLTSITMTAAVNSIVAPSNVRRYRTLLINLSHYLCVIHSDPSIAYIVTEGLVKSASA